MKKQRRGLDRHNVLHDGWRSMVCQTTPLKTEAKEDNQLNPGGPSNRRKLRSQPTKISSFKSGPSWSLTPDPPE